MRKRWRMAEACPKDFLALLDGYILPLTKGELEGVVGQLLWNRGIRTRDEVQSFLNPQWETGIHDAKQFRHMEGAIKRIFQALENGERITVHGDYDADGVTGSTVLITTLREIERQILPLTKGELEGVRSIDGTPPDPSFVRRGSKIDFYIPHRDKEGYGLHRETVPKLKERDTRLIITVDCGIACVDEIAFAKEQGMDTIVVDHHQFGEKVPDGYLIHPGLPEETYPFKKLAAVGVAYKFACALLDAARERGLDIPVGWEKWLLDLVAIATVTDMVPLVGENRVLQTYGLRVLNKSKRVGLRALIETAGLSFGSLDTESVGFAIGPRINAAGRMDHATLALNLLLSQSDDEARPFVLELERCNRARQEMTRKMIDEAEREFASHFQLQASPILFLWNEKWSPALVGLVAGKFMDKYARPTVVVGSHEGKWTGSGRSISSYDITDAMRTNGEGILVRVGGHVQACGFSLDDGSRLTELASRITQHASERLKEEDLIPSIEVDAEISLADVNQTLADQLVQLEPFGVGNPRPVFVSRGCYVAAVDTIGSQKNHLRLTLLAPDGRRIKALGFKIGERAMEVRMGSEIDLVYHITINEWNGIRSVECRILDFLCISSFVPTGEPAEIQVLPELEL